MHPLLIASLIIQAFFCGAGIALAILTEEFAPFIGLSLLGLVVVGLLWGIQGLMVTFG